MEKPGRKQLPRVQDLLRESRKQLNRRQP